MSKFKNKSFERNSVRYKNYYINRFISMKCSIDMMINGLFPNAKEITESFACFEAVRDHLEYEQKDSNIAVIVVGDGCTPRTAATFSFQSKWMCYSIDPNLRKEYPRIKRLRIIKKRIEECDNLKFHIPVILVLPHSHAKINECLLRIKSPQISIVSMPCCVPQIYSVDKKEIKPDVEYCDENVWSPCNTIKIWKNIK